MRVRARLTPKIVVSAMAAWCWFGIMMLAIRVMSVLCYGARRLSALALVVARVGADHAHHALAPHDLALAADFLDRSLDSHSRSPYLARNVIRALVKS